MLVLLARPCPGKHTHTPFCSVSVSEFTHVHACALALPAGDVWRVGSGHAVQAPVALPGLYVPLGHCVQLLVSFARKCPARHTHMLPPSISVSVLIQVQFSTLALPAGDVWRVGCGHAVHAPVAFPGLYVPLGHGVQLLVAFARV